MFVVESESVYMYYQTKNLEQSALSLLLLWIEFQFVVLVITNKINMNKAINTKFKISKRKCSDKAMSVVRGTKRPLGRTLSECSRPAALRRALDKEQNYKPA